MRIPPNMLLNLSVFVSISFATTLLTKAQANIIKPKDEMKEWTFLIYLNGNNNLDSFGKLNINQMEEVGSTKDLNVVVQWASLKNKKTQRLYVTKDKDSQNVTSPVVDDVGNVDMGNWHSVVDFVKWGAEHYPAKHYFVDIWDHGSGWHALRRLGSSIRSDFHITDISWDDNTRSSITTQQLGQALTESSKIIGHKIDFYASDACLMAMAEIAEEVADSVNIFGGSEEVEPGAGWPYQTFLRKWVAKPKSTPAEVATYLTQDYVDSYSGGVNGNQDATFSAFDLEKIDAFDKAVSTFGSEIKKLDLATRNKVIQIATTVQRFSSEDYADLMDFLNATESANVKGLAGDTTRDVKTAINEFVIAHAATADMSRAYGVSIWLPTSAGSYRSHAENYSKMKFNLKTQWGDALQALFQ